MPIHDWTRVSAGTFHDFHNAWIIHLKEMLNTGLLPRGYYAQSEQHAGLVIPDILTLQFDNEWTPPDETSGGVAVLAAPSKTSRKLVASEEGVARQRRRTLAIRHVGGHRVVALVEIASPANKDRELSVADFVDKAVSAIDRGIHVLMLDLFPLGPFDPQGLHGGIWSYFGEPESLPVGQSLTLASYDAIRGLPEVIVEHRSVGESLPDMPLFLEGNRCVNTPLERTYQMAFHGIPEHWRDALSQTP
jgi:hypothetical protein